MGDDPFLADVAHLDGEVKSQIPGALHWSIKDTSAVANPAGVAALGPAVVQEYNRNGSAINLAAQAPNGSYIVFYCSAGNNRSPLYAAAYYESVKRANNLDQKVCILVKGFAAYKTLSDQAPTNWGQGTEAYVA